MAPGPRPLARSVGRMRTLPHGGNRVAPQPPWTNHGRIHKESTLSSSQMRLKSSRLQQKLSREPGVELVDRDEDVAGNLGLGAIDGQGRPEAERSRGNAK